MATAKFSKFSGILSAALLQREAKGKGEKERYTHLNEEFQRIAKRDKKAFLSNQRKEIEENNRMGKSLSWVQLFATPWTVALQAPLSTNSQARILKWGAIPFSRGSSRLRDGTWVSLIAGRFFILSELPGKPQSILYHTPQWEDDKEGVNLLFLLVVLAPSISLFGHLQTWRHPRVSRSVFFCIT